jgi:glutamate/tyrosine decarboxylase-like PLP-dependent enzyme
MTTIEEHLQGTERPAPLFIGPKGEYAKQFGALWQHLLDTTMHRRSTRFNGDPEWVWESRGINKPPDIQRALDELLGLLREEIPTFSPRYLGHMVSDISIPSLLGHMAMLFENANLASREAAVVASRIETESINMLAKMIGLDPEPSRGHFTSGGTLANFEAVWRARYRLDHWLTLGMWLRANGHTESSLFSLAHCGWKAFHEAMNTHQLQDGDLTPYSAVLHGPVAIDRRIREELGEIWPEPVILVPGNKHYSWPKAANVFGMGAGAVWPCELDPQGRLSAASVKSQIERAIRENRPVMMVVSVAGTTELGMVDPIDEINAVLADYRDARGLHIWHHVDAAYGGYLCSTLNDKLCQLSTRSQDALRSIKAANSVTLDPHKLGFVPYACGAFLVPDSESYSVSSIHAPYLEKPQDVEFPGWSTTLEGSRAATGPSAVWLSAKVMPLDASGHGAFLNNSLTVAQQIHTALGESSTYVRRLQESDTNVVCFSLACDGDTLSQANQRTSALLEDFRASPELSVTRTHLGIDNYQRLVGSLVEQWHGSIDTDHLTVIRMVVMNPYLDNSNIVDNIQKILLACISSQT